MNPKIKNLVNAVNDLSPHYFLFFMALLARLRGWVYVRIEYPAADGHLVTATITPQGGKYSYENQGDTVMGTLPVDLPDREPTNNPLAPVYRHIN